MKASAAQSIHAPLPGHMSPQIRTLLQTVALTCLPWGLAMAPRLQGNKSQSPFIMLGLSITLREAALSHSPRLLGPLPPAWASSPL